MSFWQDILDGFIDGSTPEPLVNKKLGLDPALSEWRPGFVEKRLRVDPELFHGRALFGGYIAAIADQVLGLAAITVLEDGKFFGATNMSISYVAKASATQVIYENASKN